MKAILIAALFGILLFGAASSCFRQAQTTRRARLLVMLFLWALPLLVLVHLTTPDDLGFLSSSWVAPYWWVDLGFCFFLFASGFLGGLLQLYNLADRGLSLRMLIDILQSRDGALSAEEIVTSYSAGHGIVWMYQKRLGDMTAAGLIVARSDAICLSVKGRRMADLFAALREFVRAGSNMKSAG
jgi:hypothetical protein